LRGLSGSFAVSKPAISEKIERNCQSRTIEYQNLYFCAAMEHRSRHIENLLKTLDFSRPGTRQALFAIRL
jgi:hypothetical protein